MSRGAPDEARLRLADEARRAEPVRAATDWPSLEVTPRQVCDIELLSNGELSPLTGFMTRARGVAFQTRNPMRLAHVELCRRAMRALRVALEAGGRSVTMLDGDTVRRRLSPRLGFSREERDENVRRIGVVAAEIAPHGGTALCKPIAPLETGAQRDGYLPPAPGTPQEDPS